MSNFCYGSFRILSKRFLLLSFLFIFFIPLAYFYRQNNINIRFVDEEENIVVGKFLNKGLVLYKDIFVQHQPIAYLFSSLIQRIFHFSSIYQVIAVHRDFMIFWSIIWGVLLTYYFGTIFFFAFVCVEVIKVFLFGNLFLAESLVFYPVSFLMGFLLYKKRAGRLLNIFLGALCSFLFLTLLAVWPFVLVFLILYSFRNQNKRSFNDITLGFFLFSLIIFLVSGFYLRGYLYDVFYINLNFYVPQTGQISVFKSFFPFFDIFFNPYDETRFLLVLRLFSGLFLLVIAILLLKDKLSALSYFLLLGILNLRYIGPGFDFYRGFHSLPWFSSLVFVSFFISRKVLVEFKIGKFLFITLIILVYLVSFVQVRDLLFTFRDKSRDYYVNYSAPFDIGLAVNIMKRRESRMFIAPDQHLIYWQADILPFSEFVFYYPWMDKSDVFRRKIDEKFALGLPDFFFCSDPYLDVCKKLTGYVRVKKDNRYTGLYVLNSLASSLDENQMNQLKFYNFSF